MPENAKAVVSVIGTGHVGLPLALYLAEKGHTVYGIDNNAEMVARLEDKRMPFLEDGAAVLLRKHTGKRFLPTVDWRRAAEASVIIVTIGTPVDEHMNPVFVQLEDVLGRLLGVLKRGQLLILRSTVSPGTTEYVKRLIERKTRLKVGKSIFLAFCPERIAQGHSLKELPVVPQIVGALDDASRNRACAFFKPLTQTVVAADACSAELAKLFCNMYRYINFAIANEFMMLAGQHGRDIHTVLDLVNRNYPRGGVRLPGLTGGPCLYKDGFFLINRAPFTDLISVAWKINQTVPAFLVDEVRKRMSLDGSRAVILGLGFKRNSDDTRNSLSYKLKKILAVEGAEVVLHDPYVKPGDLKKVLARADVIFVAMNHEAYEKLGLARLRKMTRKGALLCDVWNVFGTGKIVTTLR